MTKLVTTPKNAREAIAALTQDYAKMSKSAIFRAHFEEIEKAIGCGVNQVAIVGALQKSGIDLPLATFKKYLYRERRRSKSSVPAPPFRSDGPLATKTTHAPEKSAFVRSDPRALDAIIHSTPDLDQLAKMRKANQRNDHI